MINQCYYFLIGGLLLSQAKQLRRYFVLDCLNIYYSTFLYIEYIEYLFLFVILNYFTFYLKTFLLV
jgi:hypothetical protein